jgi:hypothetical protein
MVRWNETGLRAGVSDVELSWIGTSRLATACGAPLERGAGCRPAMKDNQPGSRNQCARWAFTVVSGAPGRLRSVACCAAAPLCRAS